MAEHDDEEVIAVTTDNNKRKHDELAQSPPPQKIDDDDSEAKRPRFDDVLATENGHQDKKADESDIDAQPSVENCTPAEDAPQAAEEAPEKGNDEELDANDQQDDNIQQPSGENFQLKNAQEASVSGELLGPSNEIQNPPANAHQHGDDSSTEQQDSSGSISVTRKMEVPNTKVGVLIGKAGETIKLLQLNSGVRIQITRDAEADPHASTRPVELIGTLENVYKAEKLIRDVIAEADAGGSPSLVARGYSTVQAAAGEQIQIEVPNEKVGLIIGKGGETIKNLQTQSGARIQLIPQRLPEGDQSKERIVRVTGDKKQIEMARELIKEAMEQPVRRSPMSGGYNQQAFQPRGTASQWGPRGPPPAHQAGYDYQHQGRYQSQNAQYAPTAYGNYPPQQLASRNNFGWEHRPPTTLQGPPQGGYDYYGRQGGHAPKHPHVLVTSPAMGPPPPSQANYNYGQPQGPDYGQPVPYSQTAPPAQSYGQGYNEAKYENQVVMQHPYGGNGAMQQSAYPQGTTQPGYGVQDPYGKPPSYGASLQGSQAQPYYGQPRATQSGVLGYQAPNSSVQSYVQPASSQAYPYGSTGQPPQNYPPYGSAPSAPSADGYNNAAPATTPTTGYPQQGGQPVAVYGQPGGQQAPGYAQYPASQPVYTEQAVPTSAAYGYQGTADSAYNAGQGTSYAAPPVGQSAFPQLPTTQQGYDQTIPQSGGYATAPAGYGKTASPQAGYPQYDASQMYGAQH